MRMFFIRYRRTISLIIVVIVALILSKIYIDMNKSWEEKIFNQEEKIYYNNIEITLGKYIASLNILTENQKVEYCLFDIDNDNQNEIIIKYYEDKKTRYSVINREGRNVIYDISNDQDISSLRLDGLYRVSNSNYAYIQIERGNVSSNLYLYASNGKYYYNKSEITYEQYQEHILKHLEYEKISWTVVK